MTEDCQGKDSFEAPYLHVRQRGGVTGTREERIGAGQPSDCAQQGTGGENQQQAVLQKKERR